MRGKAIKNPGEIGTSGFGKGKLTIDFPKSYWKYNRFFRSEE
jgi:hypothetical protein